MLHNPHAAIAGQEPEYWMLVREDENGTRELRRDGIGKRRAEMDLEGLNSFKDKKSCKYFIFPYTASTKEAVLKRERVRQ